MNPRDRDPEDKHLEKTSIDRRTFLDRILAGWATFAMAPVVYGTIRYLLPIPSSHHTEAKDIVVANLTELAPNSGKVIRVDDHPIMLIETKSGQVKALSARCTHLGCTVQYAPEQGGYLRCNCHGSRFDLNGNNVSGPAPRPLPHYKVTLEGGKIAIRV